MNTATVSRLRHLAAWALAAVLIWTHTAAQACPGCKQNMVPGADGSTPPLNGASVGFGLSIFFMIFMIVALLGGLGLMMNRACRALAAQQRAALAEMEAEEAGFSNGSLPVRA